MIRATPLIFGGALALMVLWLAACSSEPAEVDPALQALTEDGRVIRASETRRLPDTLDARAWRHTEIHTLMLYPQRSVSPTHSGKTIQAQLQMLVSGDEMALRLRWPDPHADIRRQDRTDHFADAVAVQWGVDAKAQLPYIGMGEPMRPVALWYQQAGGEPQSLTARGFGSLQPNRNAPLPMVRMERDGEHWIALLKGSFPPGVNPLPLAVAVWDGGHAERNGSKRLSGWHMLSLPGAEANPQALQALLAQSRSHGDPAQGAQLAVQHGCIACHSLPGHPPSEIGPDLTLAGKLHWPGYLRRVIEEPSAFIVPGEGYSTVDPQGQRISLMPKLPLTEQQVEDLVAYLQQGVK